MKPFLYKKRDGLCGFAIVLMSKNRENKMSYDRFKAQREGWEKLSNWLKTSLKDAIWMNGDILRKNRFGN